MEETDLHSAFTRSTHVLQLQKYDLRVEFVRGKDIPLADALSRNFLPDTYPELSEGMDAHVRSVVNNVPFSANRLDEIRNATNSDTRFQNLKNVIKYGWPDERRSCQPSVIEFWNHRDQLSVAEDIIFKGDKIVIPMSLRKSMVEVVHSSHMGIEKSTKTR